MGRRRGDQGDATAVALCEWVSELGAALYLFPAKLVLFWPKRDAAPPELIECLRMESWGIVRLITRQAAGSVEPELPSGTDDVFAPVEPGQWEEWGEDHAAPITRVLQPEAGFEDDAAQTAEGAEPVAEAEAEEAQVTYATGGTAGVPSVAIPQPA